MDPAAFLADLEAKPATLLALLDNLPSWPEAGRGPIVLTGMGSSWFAADVAARRFRRHGIAAVAELASVEATFPPSPDLTVIGITASGKSAETIALLAAHCGVSRTIALTNETSASLPTERSTDATDGCRQSSNRSMAQKVCGCSRRPNDSVRHCKER